MKNRLRRILLALIILTSVSALPAQNLRDQQFMDRAQAGFGDMFNLDYDKARLIFSQLGKEYPHHPAPPLYLACISWLEELLRRQDLALNRFIAPSYFSEKTSLVMPQKERTAFFDNLGKCRELASAILQKNRRDTDARYFMATAHGLQASFAITIDHSLREAFTSGNRAYSSNRELIEERPDYYDAHMTVGIYEYVVGDIPWYLRWLALAIGARGSKEEGIAHLKIAAEKGQFVRTEAQLVSMVLFVRERRYAEALEIARSLNDRYPRSFIFPINVAQILQLSGKKEAAASMFIQVEKRAEAGEPNFDKIPLQPYRFNLGIDLMWMGQLDAAEERFRKTIADAKARKREKALSRLNLGKILDWKGRPKEAAREYQAVLALENFDDSHNQAKQLLKKHH